jgi:hypothetical protein
LEEIKMDDYEITKDDILLMMGKVDACLDMGIEYININCNLLLFVLQELFVYMTSDEIIKNKKSDVNESNLN